MAAPKITTMVKDVNSKTVGLTGDSSKLIRFHSNAKASMTITPNSGAIYLDSISITHGGEKKDYEKLSGDELSCNYIFENVTNNVFMFYAEDEYGNGTTVIDDESEMIDYVHLTCNIAYSKLEAVGTTADMRLSCTGNYYNGSFGDVGSGAKSNSLTVEYKYTDSDGNSGEGIMTVTKSGNTYSAYADLKGLNHEATYDFVVTAKDKLEEVTSSESGVTSLPLFHWGKNNFTFEVPVTFNGGFTTSDSYFKSGYWFPLLDLEDGCVSYDDLLGWYQKLGSVVTIGWYLKAEVDSGWDGTTLKIIGVPFAPLVKAFGGGVAFNVFLGEKFFFEGWCIEPSGEIKARLQSHEKDEDTGNLKISSECYYPVGGGIVTLGGTICYMIGG